MPGFEDGCAVGVGVDLVERGGRLSRGKRCKLKTVLLPLLDERGVDRPGVVVLDQAAAHLGRGPADLPVQIGDESGEPLALGGDVVDGCVGEAVDGVLDQPPHVVRSEDLLLDGVEHESVQLLHPDRDPVTGCRVVLARGAVVEVGPLLWASARGHADPATAGSASQPGSQQAAIAEADRIRAVALASLSVAVAQGTLCLYPSKGLLVYGGLVGVPGDDLAAVDQVAGVGGVGQDGGHVLGAPGAGGDLPGEVVAGGRCDGLPRQPGRDARGPVTVLVGHPEDALDCIEPRASSVGDQQPTVLDLVAPRRAAIDPSTFLRLGSHSTLHAGG